MLVTTNIPLAILARSQNSEKGLLAPPCLSVSPSIRMSVRVKQLGSHWKDFREIWYLSVFRNSVEKIPVSLKFGKKSEYFT
jgi:hypothetical protein